MTLDQFSKPSLKGIRFSVYFICPKKLNLNLLVCHTLGDLQLSLRGCSATSLLGIPIISFLCPISRYSNSFFSFWWTPQSGRRVCSPAALLLCGYELVSSVPQSLSLLTLCAGVVFVLISVRAFARGSLHLLFRENFLGLLHWYFCLTFL